MIFSTAFVVNDMCEPGYDKDFPYNNKEYSFNSAYIIKEIVSLLDDGNNGVQETYKMIENGANINIFSNISIKYKFNQSEIVKYTHLISIFKRIVVEFELQKEPVIKTTRIDEFEFLRALINQMESNKKYIEDSRLSFTIQIK